MRFYILFLYCPISFLLTIIPKTISDLEMDKGRFYISFIL